MGSDHDDLSRNYEKAFAGHLPFGRRPALLIVDFVMAYLDPASPLYAGVEAELEANQRLVTAARAAGLPIVFTNVTYTPGGANGGLFYRKVPALKAFDEGSPLGHFPPGLEPEASDLVITKQYASAFFGTTLAADLSAMGIDSLLITGLSTSGCVRASALDALQYGFIPYLVREGCGDRHPAPHEAALFDLQAKYAEVVDLAEALSLIAASAERG